MRLGSTSGLSGPTWVLLDLTFLVWLVWGIVSRDVFVASTNLVALPGGLWVLWRIFRDGGISFLAICGVLAVGFALLSFQFLAGLDAMLVSVVMLTVLTRSLQIVKLRKVEDASGVSLFPWLVGAFSQVCWWWYGLEVGNFVVAAHAPVAVVANLVLVSAVIARSRRSSRAASVV